MEIKPPLLLAVLFRTLPGFLFTVTEAEGQQETKGGRMMEIGTQHKGPWNQGLKKPLKTCYSVYIWSSVSSVV